MQPVAMFDRRFGSGFFIVACTVRSSTASTLAIVWVMKAFSVPAAFPRQSKGRQVPDWRSLRCQPMTDDKATVVWRFRRSTIGLQRTHRPGL